MASASCLQISMLSKKLIILGSSMIYVQLQHTFLAQLNCKRVIGTYQHPAAGCLVLCTCFAHGTARWSAMGEV
jgi:hypothetical protein